jgi:hypothetical protein
MVEKGSKVEIDMDTGFMLMLLPFGLPGSDVVLTLAAMLFIVVVMIGSRQWFRDRKP